MRVWHFIVKILVVISESMSSVVLEIVHVHVVIVKEHASVDVLRKEVEADIIYVSRHEFIHWKLLVAPVNGQRQRKVAGLKNGHLALKILILASVVILVSVTYTDS